MTLDQCSLLQIVKLCLQHDFVVQVVSALLRCNWQDFNWHDASRSFLAIAELLVPFRYRLTQAVLENRPLNGCSNSCCYNMHIFVNTSYIHLQLRSRLVVVMVVVVAAAVVVVVVAAVIAVAAAHYLKILMSSSQESFRLGNVNSLCRFMKYLLPSV